MEGTPLRTPLNRRETHYRLRLVAASSLYGISSVL
jgi:hypothetical protein